MEGNGKGYNPVTIANYFIGLNSDKGLTLMQLLKLSYIAHGVTLAVLSRPNQDDYLLANEYVEAWKYGPVFPSIYHEFKAQPGYIRKKAQRYNPTTSQLENWTAGFSEDEEKIISGVYNKYGHLEGWELSVITHKKGTPWKESWQKGKRIGEFAISNDLIKKYYLKILKNPKIEEDINEG